MEKIIIAAVAEGGAIGKGGSLPWDLPEDRKHFKEVTWGFPVIMGRRTFESIGRVLPGRLNIILSRTELSLPDGAVHAGSLQDAYAIAESTGADKCFIAGGAEVYRQTLPDADRLDITLVHRKVDGADAFFPIDLLNL